MFKFDEAGNRLGYFIDAAPIKVPESIGGMFTLRNLNINPLDMDGDGNVEFIYMPHLMDYSFYRIEDTLPDLITTGYIWNQGLVISPDLVDSRIDFGRDAENIKLFDVDNDHLIDIVRTTGTQIQSWLNLGRYPGGRARFGQPVFDEEGNLVELSKQRHLSTKLCLVKVKKINFFLLGGDFYIF
jgi:hypothetical protein